MRPEDAVRELLDVDKLKVVFQPLLALSNARVFAYETLVRSPEFKSPPALFEAAVEHKCVGALGRIIRRKAVQECDGFPLFLNIHPNEFDEGWLVRPDDPIFHHEHEVFLEITESVPLTHFALCNSVLREVRGKDVRLAVDDLGAGYSNLKYIADLNPEVVKLDRALVANLSKDKRLLKLVRSLVLLCNELDAEVVAEGIETIDELHAARDSGVHYGQGYFIARPDFPPPEVDTKAMALT